MKTVLITGADGYLGGRILEHLGGLPSIRLKLGILDPDASGCTAHPLYRKHEICQYNLLKPDTFRRLLSNVDHVIHLAALNHAECEANPELARQINENAVERLLMAAINAKVGQFIYFSTFHVYNLKKIKNNQVDENTPAGPESIYAETHLNAENHVLIAHYKGQIRGLVFRLSNALGAPVLPTVNAWMLIVNDLCRQAVLHKRLILKSSGIQQRNFVPIRDVVRGVAHALTLQPEKLPLYNLGGNESIRIVDMAKKIQTLSKDSLGYQPDLVIPMATQSDKVRQQAFDYNSGKFLATGFKYTSSLEEELKRTLTFCKENFGA